LTEALAMAGTRTIKAIAFDAYGTLFDVYSIGAVAEDLFPGAGKPLAELWRDRQIDYTRIRTLSGRYADFWSVTGDALDFACDRLGLTLTPASRNRLMDQYACLPPFPENLDALKQLRGLGLPLAILSNGTHQMIASAVSAAGMEGMFDHILSADSVRKFKTSPEAYQLGPNAFGCPPSEILFVSSNAWDVCGAAWFGYAAFWVNRSVAPLERLDSRPAGEGRSLDDVVSFVRSSPAPAK
jgi:2-haloacid dehalogenase